MTAAVLDLSASKQANRDAELDDHYEVVDGVRVELPPMSVKSNLVSNRIREAINDFSRPKKLGKAYNEVLIRLRIKKKRDRKPDVIYLPYAKWPEDQFGTDANAWDVVPDICVEVNSPTDLSKTLETKIGEYLEAGVKLVWVVYPDTARIHVYESMDKVRMLDRSRMLDGGDVLPGFQVPLAELLPEAVVDETNDT